MKQPWVPMRVKGVAMDSVNASPVVILSDEESTRSFPVLAGPAEASAVIIALEGMNPSRPLSHDVIVNLLANQKCQVLSIDIYGDYDGDLLARLCFRRGSRVDQLELRPCDAVAVAVRLGLSLNVESWLVEEEARSPSFAFDFSGDRDSLWYFEPEYAALGD